jgi:Hemerythrin HHE cation binding domain
MRADGPRGRGLSLTAQKEHAYENPIDEEGGAMHLTEKVASGLMGAAKAAKATLEGATGVFKELMREHGEVTALLIRVKKTSDVGVRRELFPKIREDLVAHEKGELAAVYPVFRTHEDLAAYAEMHEREAGSLERMIQRLSGMAYEDTEWESAFADLMREFSHHVKEEESEYFPVASRTLGKKVTEAMMTPYETAKRAIS